MAKLHRPENVALVVFLTALTIAAFVLGEDSKDILEHVMFWLIGWLGHAPISRCPTTEGQS